MPCSSCNEWITEWIVWRRFDAERVVVGCDLLSFQLSPSQNLQWFFFCRRCRRRDRNLRGWYINADGAVSSDSEDSDDL